MKGIDMEWWGYSKEHGWVVLDRTIPANSPGLKGDLQFVRCRDSSQFIEKREKWIPPGYRFAPNYLRDLQPEDSVTATAELEVFKSLWPELQSRIQRERRETEEREAALRLEAEKKLKADAKKSKKLAAAAKPQALAVAPS